MYFPILYTTKNELKEELDGINNDNYKESEIIKLFSENYKNYGLEKKQRKICREKKKCIFGEKKIMWHRE